MGALMIAGGLAVGCVPAPVGGSPEYLGAVARLVTDDVLQSEVRFRGTPDEGRAYGLCVAAMAATLRGDVWLRHLRTIAHDEAGVRRLDTLYSLSQARPEGVEPIRAREAVVDCETNGIPVV